MGKLTTLSGLLKDEASQMKLNVVHLCSSENAKTIDLALLKATTHTSYEPPSDKYVNLLQSTVDTHYGPETIAAVVQRLRLTTDVCVAAKCLILLHKMSTSESGHKGEGVTPNIKESSEDKRLETQRVSSYTTDCIFKQIGLLVDLFENIGARPETTMSKSNKIVIKMIELMVKDCFSAMILIKIRFEELNARKAKREEMVLALVSLEKCKEALSDFSWQRKYFVEDFWCLVLKLKQG
ncbi:putative clathrin assembly protein [Raphanus sativus]|nr:putative clathrin assembly protein [Raphanus sativus]